MTGELRIVLKKKTHISTDSGLKVTVETKQVNAELKVSHPSQTVQTSSKASFSLPNNPKRTILKKPSPTQVNAGQQVQNNPIKFEKRPKQREKFEKNHQNSKGNANRGSRGPPRNVFEDYYPSECIENGLKEQKMHQGVLRMNPKNRNHGYITIQGLESDIFIHGKKYINRALNGDTVIVEIFQGEDLKREIAYFESKQKEKQVENDSRQKKCDLELELEELEDLIQDEDELLEEEEEEDQQGM